MWKQTNIGESQIVLSNGTRHVSIWRQGGVVEARKYTGHDDFFQSNASPLAWKGKTLRGAIKWADKNLV